MKKQLPLILSGLACVLAAVAFVRSGTGASPTPGGAANKPAGPSVSSAIAPAPAPEATTFQRRTPAAHRPDQQAHDSAVLLDIQNRLFHMEKTLSQMRGGWEGLARRGLVPLTEEDVLKFQQQAANPNLSVEERLSALSLLRRHRAINDEVVQSLTQLAQTTTDTRVREQIFAQMDGVTNAALQGPLLAAVSQEQDAGVRARAADALSSFSSDPTVQSWLRHLAENDPDERVRRESRQALNQRLERMEPAGLQQVVLDTATSASEKLEAAGRLRRQGATTPEVVSTMVDLYQASADPGLHADILRQLDGVNDPALREPLLQVLANEQNARVREEAADALSSFRTDPDVAAWLQHVAQNDPDPRVQREAQAALEGQEEQRGGRSRFDRGGRGRGGR